MSNLIQTMVAIPLFAALGAPAATTLQDAERIALTAVPGGIVQDIERERHLGGDVFDVEVLTPEGTEYEVIIDADDGRILSTRRDD